MAGNSGMGNTHLACALAYATCARVRRLEFFTVTGLVAAAPPAGGAAGLLVLVEPGCVPSSKAGAKLTFMVATRVYERTSLMVTTNLPFETLPGGVGKRAA